MTDTDSYETNGCGDRDIANILEDWAWVFDEQQQGRLPMQAGRFVAVLNKAVVGSGDLDNELRKAVAAKHQVDPDTIVIRCVSDED